MDAPASAADFNTVRRVIFDLAIVFLPVTGLSSIARYTPSSSHRIAEHRSQRKGARAIRAGVRALASCSKKIRPRPFGRAAENPWQASLGGSFKQTFGLHGILDLRPRGDAFHIGLHVRPLAEVDRLYLGPVQNGEKIGICDRELLAHEILAAGERPIEVGETVRRVLP